MPTANCQLQIARVELPVSSLSLPPPSLFFLLSAKPAESRRRQRVVWLTHVQLSLRCACACLCMCAFVCVDQLPKIASWCDVDCVELHKKWVKMRLVPARLPAASPLPVSGQCGVSWWTSLRQKGKVIHCCCRLCCCCQLLSRRFQHSLVFVRCSFPWHAEKQVFIFMQLWTRARHLIFVLCIKGSWHYCCCCSCCCFSCCCCHLDCCCCCWRCWPASCRLPTSCQGAFSTQLPFHLCISTLPVYKVITTQARQSVSGWVYSEMGKMGGLGVCETSVKNVTIMRFDLALRGLNWFSVFSLWKENAKLHLIIA